LEIYATFKPFHNSISIDCLNVKHYGFIKFRENNDKSYDALII
jgi:hypothetical protein